MRRIYRPVVESVERRELMSVLAVLHHPHSVHVEAAGGGTGGGSGSGSGTSSGGVQGINNELLNPTGTPTRHEQARQQFWARFAGPVLVGPGRTTTQARTIYIQGTGSSSYFLHGTGRLGVVIPKDPTAPITGQVSLFDKNINANTVVGLDIVGIPGAVDSHGRPTRFTFTTDVNVSSGIFVEAISQGTIDIRYDQNGMALVLVRGQAYTIGTANVLRNADILQQARTRG